MLNEIAEDIIKLASKNVGINLTFERKKGWSEVLSEVKQKKLDFALGTGETKNKKTYGLFTKPYITFPLVIATKNDVSYISKTSDLRGKIVAVGKNYTAHAFLRDTYPNIKLLVVSDSDEALKAVSNNKAYAMIDILPVVAHKIQQLNLSNIKISGDTEYKFEVKSLIRNDYPELVSILNKGIDSIDEKTKNEILSRWLAVKYVKEINYTSLIEVILGFTLLIILIVYYKNIKLKKSYNTLKSTLIDLDKTRENLISSEKMAHVGELVGGVTHEIATPLSVGIMASSYIKEITDDIERLYLDSSMTEQEFKEYIGNVKKISNNIHTSLFRTKDLVNSFKDVAVDQVVEEKRDFNVKLYLDDILLSLKNKLNNRNIQVTVNCDKELIIYNYPGYIAQILFNFINNSLLHAFEEADKGEITISVKLLNSHIELFYSDNGKGVNKDIQEKLFTQYYTTKKNQGGTGLGLFIVKSIVENKLKGNLEFKSEPNAGVQITIIIPN